MSQVPLAPPPQTGQPIDSWLYLLWSRLTATGQLLWASIVPGTSADVAAVVTDETGSPGSLVFSGNPTLAGVTTTDDILVSGTGILFTANMSAATHSDRFCFQNNQTNGNSFLALRPNGTATLAGFRGYSSSDMDNAVLGDYVSSPTEVFFSATKVGTGTFVPFRIKTSNTERFSIAADGTTTLGGLDTAPALKVTPVASQARWIEVTAATSSTHPKIAASAGSLEITSGISLPLATNTGATLTITDAHHTIIQTTAASVYTLPTASSYTGRCLRIVTQFAGTVTSASSNVVPLAGGAAGTAILAATAGKWADLQSDGTNWVIVAAN